MVEPPNTTGFTGVVWEARPAEKLARELTTGRGSVPMAEAGVAWGKLAATFGEAVAEYDQIVGSVQQAWQSNSADETVTKIGKLREWLLDAAGSAAANAQKAGVQALAYEVAKLAMPAAEAVAALESVMEAIAQAGAPLGGPLVAIAAKTEGQANQAKSSAARVMHTYEAATVPLATPWEQAPPPKIATEHALAAERAHAKRPAPQHAAPGLPAGVSAALAGLASFASVPRAQTAYHAQTFHQSAAVTEAAEAAEVDQVTATPVQANNSPMGVPGAMAPAAAMGDQQRSIRAGASGLDYSGADLIGLEASAGPSAPPVVGGAEPKGPTVKGTP